MSYLDEIYYRLNDDVELLDREEMGESEVQKFYSGKTLFITGVTGFVGQCLLEKLLRSCPDLERIYILLRRKRDATIEERLEKYFQHEIFQSLRKVNPEFEDKVAVIEGDLLSGGLGLSEESRNIIKTEVNIIIHNAAIVKFNDKARNILRVNVLGTNELLDLAEGCDNLEVFMYVSTAYSHCYRKIIEEKFYPFHGDLSLVHDMIKADEGTETGLSEESVQMLVGDHFFLYTFSKAIAEDLVRQRSERVKFGCGVFRPAMVINAEKEPLIGWIGNVNGQILGILLVILGIVHTGVHDWQIIDMVPCDYIVNALIIVTQDASKRCITDKKGRIYNYGSSVLNPLTLLDLHRIRNKLPVNERSSKAIWMDFILVTRSRWIFYIWHIMFHFIPACIADTVLLLNGKKPIVISKFWKVTRNSHKIEYLSNSDWRIHMPQTLEVIESLNSTDKKLFHCDIRQLDWVPYSFYGWRGLRKYILKESPNSKAGARRYILLWFAHWGLIFITIMSLIYYFMKLIF